jgi:hypothetical protein
LRPAPIAPITVAVPVTTSPPAHTRSFDLRLVSSSATMLPFLPIDSPGVVVGMSGFGLLPIAVHAFLLGVLRFLPSGRAANVAVQRPARRWQ